MGISNHELHNEFPEYSDLIDTLSNSEPHFAKELHRYSQLDQELEALELRGTPISDDQFARLKRERAHLKDWLYHQLVAVSKS